MKRVWSRCQTNFLTGLALIMPAVLSIAVVVWLFGTVANVTDKLLIIVPKRWKYVNGISGEHYWYWSLLAFLLTILLVALIGSFARHYVVHKIIQLTDGILSRVPLLNKIYGTLKQVNEAFTSNTKSAFKQVVLVEFPRAGLYSLGFLTGDQHQEVQVKTREHVVSVFVPTTPNPTTGFLILVPQNKVTNLEMSVADGIKFIISLGAIAPIYSPTANPALQTASGTAPPSPLGHDPGSSLDKPEGR